MTTAPELCDSLVALLAAIEAGEMTASTAMRHRIEGAIVALEALQDGQPEAILERLGLKDV